MAEVSIQEGESLENALRRFKRKVQQEDIIKEIKKHSYYMKPGEKRRAKQALVAQAAAQEAAAGAGLSSRSGRAVAPGFSKAPSDQSDLGPTFFPGVSQHNLTITGGAAGSRNQRGASEQHMEYHDKVLKCAECSQEFVFTAGEQMFFADKGFKNEPKRCKDCKAKRSQSPGPAPAKALPTSNGRKPKPPARSAERKLPFLSARRRVAPCSAANASSSGGA